MVIPRSPNYHLTQSKQTPLTQSTQIILLHIYSFLQNTQLKNLQWGIRMCGFKATHPYLYSNDLMRVTLYLA